MNASTPKSAGRTPAASPVMKWVFPARKRAALERLKAEIFLELLQEALREVRVRLVMVEAGRYDAKDLRGYASMASGMGMLAERHKYVQRFDKSPKWLEYLPVALARRCLVMAQSCGRALPASLEELYVPGGREKK